MSTVAVDSRQERSERRNVMRLGLIGCGSIGGAVAMALARQAAPEIELIGLADPVNPAAAKRVGTEAQCLICPDIASLIDLGLDLVLEAASPDAVRAYGGCVFDGGAHLMMISVGALADADFLEELIGHARRKGRRLLVPSGAIGGVDVIKAAAIGGLEECRLTTTKPPDSLNSVYVRERRIDLANIRHATLIFEGTALEAVRHFPKNLNVAVTIGLAGLGLQRTAVRLIADPETKHNTHEVFVRGAFGEATVRLVNRPSADNPRSSALVCYSVIATLQGISQQFHLGA